MELFEKKRRTPSVSLTPLIDILFLLIIFFVVSSRLDSEFGVGMELPESAQGQNEVQVELVLEMNADGKILLDNTALATEQLPDALRTLHASEGDRPLTLKIDRRVEHGKVVELMDVAQAAGFQKVSFGVSPK